MEKTTVAAAVGALVVIGAGATVAAHAEAHHTMQTSPGCKIISVTKTAPVYSSLYDRTGEVATITVEKCQGQTVTRVTHSIVTRTVKVPCGVHTPDAVYRPC